MVKEYTESDDVNLIVVGTRNVGSKKMLFESIASGILMQRVHMIVNEEK